MTDYQATPDDERLGGARHRAAQRAEMPRAVRRGSEAVRRRHGVPEGQTVFDFVADIERDEIDRRLAELRAREIHAANVEAHIRMLEDRARQASVEARRAELRLSETRDALNRDAAARQAAAGSAPPRADRVQSAAVRDHELARMKAKLMNGEAAGAELAERLRFAHVQAGKQSLDALGAAVGYSKATLSKVLNGKMSPAWALVRKLAAEFKVPLSVLNQEWHPLWIAADMHRQQNRGQLAETAEIPRTGTVPASPGQAGHTCPKCGAWVVDSPMHAGWHMTMEPGGEAPDAESMDEAWNHQSQGFNLLREALGTDRDL
ncbi:helix-turn-helix domain-containing protein [Paractinoplanes atraurantiacus]|uniref:HTH cro/C1-type domain-containing protein n=1 Tax=Paractinoplanes atraurantiacus TaxID=1036182 RepID=A0A285KLV4_9ACTN|nr:helix-turn-helix transcriptional regulator [Actinoplanes atraurantiacus]SNY72857.1 hypothetical protein SAMN05421748_14433 [Actinoplanes atraurantiacus]